MKSQLDLILSKIFKLINRKNIFIFSLLLVVTGSICFIYANFTPDENRPERFTIFTNSNYCNELNSYFNRTDATLIEDAKNKLIENYQVSGYIIKPKTTPPPTGYPVIIWMHGFGACSDFQLNFPRQFAKSGFFTISIDQPGHGYSGGLWDMGITTLLGIYSTIDWLVNASSYKAIIDIGRIGVSGHSMGGIAATQAGLYDKMINTKTNHLVGTGLISSVCAIFCWDNLGTMAENLIKKYIGINDVWNQKDIQELLTRWRWFINHDPSTLQNEILIRSPAEHINITNIKNYCLILGENDELITISQVLNLMSNSTRDEFSIPIVSKEQISANITSNNNKTWDFSTNIDSNEYKRRMVVVPGIEHILEGFSQRVCQNTTYWFYDTLNCEVLSTINPNVPSSFQTKHLIKLLGWALFLESILIIIFPTISFLMEKINKRTPPSSKTKQENDKKLNKKVYGLLVLGFFLTIPTGLIPLNSITYFWIFNLIVPKFLIISLILFPIAILVYKLIERNDKCVNQSTTLNLKYELKVIGTTLMPLVIWILIFNIIAYLNQVPILGPRPLTNESYSIILDFFIVLSIMFIFNFNLELIFRASIQSQIKTPVEDIKQKLFKYMKSGLCSGIFIGFIFATNLLIDFFGIFTNIPLLIIILYIGIITLFSIIGFFNSYIYDKSKSIIATSLFQSLLITILVSSKLGIVYA